MKINNVPKMSKNRKFIVFRVVDGANWFYDAWDDFDRALKQAIEIEGQVAPIEKKMQSNGHALL